MTNRNDPCLCGSGKKYKRCCADRERIQEQLGRRIDLRRAKGRGPPIRVPLGTPLPDPWEVALVPLMARYHDDEAARPMGLIIVSNGIPLHLHIVDRAPAEPAELAWHVEQALLEVIGYTGTTPGQVHVRHEAVAAHLAPRLTARGIAVRAVRDLPQSAEVSRALIDGFAEGAPAASVPETWAAWDLPREQVATLFASSAAFYRAAPWRSLPERRVLAAQVPGGDQWWVMVLSDGAGLTLFEEADDVTRWFSSSDPGYVIRASAGAIITMSLVAKSDLPERSRREIRDAQWEVAGPRAYPQLVVLNTPGGGISRRQAADLGALLDAVPRFVAAHRELLESGQRVDEVMQWKDEPSGTGFLFRDLAAPKSESPWEVSTTLSPSGPEGSGAQPGARVAHLPEAERKTLVEDTLDRFAQYLQRSGKKPLSPATARRRAMALRPFLDYLIYVTGIPIQAVTECELRDFLYHWYPQKVMDTEKVAQSLPGSMRRFFDFLGEVDGVQCLWAEPILRDGDVFMSRWKSRPPGMFMDEPVRDWVAELSTDLAERLLLPSFEADSGIEWGEYAGPVEARLSDDLHRCWLVWRDEVIRAGVSDREGVRAELLERERAWSRAPNSLVDGKTPAQAIVLEQREQRAR